MPAVQSPDATPSGLSACTMSRMSHTKSARRSIGENECVARTESRTVLARTVIHQGPGQGSGGKNTNERTSMLSRGEAPRANGLSNEVWNDNLARPSLALSCTRINTTSSVCISEK
jgi:hypothetical protein